MGLIPVENTIEPTREHRNKLGASPQLECWNVGLMGSGIM